MADVGANRGDFSAMFVAAIEEQQEEARGGGPTSTWCIHLFEPDREEVAHLRDRLEEERWTQHRGIASVAVHEVAVSDRNADAVPMYFPKRSVQQAHPHAAFQESIFLWKGMDESSMPRRDDVVAVSLDRAFGAGAAEEAEVHADVMAAGESTINIIAAGTAAVGTIKIDVEGHDFRVLRGARGLLRAGRVGVVLLEYGHGWATECDTSKESLKVAVVELDAFGFDSYLVGKGGELLRLSGGCWVDDYETWAWSNVVSVSRSLRPSLAEAWGAASAVRPAPPPPEQE